MHKLSYTATLIAITVVFGLRCQAQVVACDHPFDAENAVINSKPCDMVEEGREGGWGSAIDDYTQTNQEMADAQASACQELAHTLTQQCGRLPSGRERNQCMDQEQRRTANNCNGPVATPTQGTDGSKNDPYSAAIASPARARALASGAIQPTCVDYFRRNFNYCRKVTNSKVAAACRELTSRAFQSCLIAEGQPIAGSKAAANHH